MRVTIKVHGVEDVKAALASLPAGFRENAMHSLLFEAARPIEAAAEARAPVKTGKLRKSIISGLRAKGARAAKGAGIFIGSTSPLAHLQEWGAAHHAAQPFMRPAFDGQARRARDIIQQGLLDLLSKAAKRAPPVKLGD